MGRPVNKKFFGDGSIMCKAKIDANPAADGFIVKQTSTREFIVNVDGDEYTCVLVAVPAEDLEIGQMSIGVVNAIGEIVQVEGFKGKVLTTSEGKQATWNTGTNNAPQFVVETVDSPLVPAVIVAPTTTANGSIGAQFRKPNTSYMLLGNTNPINKMQVATDGRIEVAMGPGFKGSSSGNPDSVNGTYTFQLLDGFTNANGTIVKDDWNFRFAFGLKQNPGDKKLTDLYNIVITIKKANVVISTMTLVEKNGTIVVETPGGTIVDSYVSANGDILQNIQRTSFIAPEHKTGTFTLIASATPKNGDPVVTAQFDVVALPAV